MILVPPFCKSCMRYMISLLQKHVGHRRNEAKEHGQSSRPCGRTDEQTVGRSAGRTVRRTDCRTDVQFNSLQLQVARTPLSASPALPQKPSKSCMPYMILGNHVWHLTVCTQHLVQSRYFLPFLKSAWQCKWMTLHGWHNLVLTAILHTFLP